MRGEKYRKAQAFLDGKSKITTIIRNNKKSYSLIINGEIIKQFKKRDSCNKRIMKMYLNELQDENRIKINRRRNFSSK